MIPCSEVPWSDMKGPAKQKVCQTCPVMKKCLVLARSLPLSVTGGEVWGGQLFKESPDSPHVETRQGYLLSEAEWGLMGNRPGFLIAEGLGIKLTHLQKVCNKLGRSDLAERLSER